MYLYQPAGRQPAHLYLYLYQPAGRWQRQAATQIVMLSANGFADMRRSSSAPNLTYMATLYVCTQRKSSAD
jgi:hypothetical protein